VPAHGSIPHGTAARKHRVLIFVHGYNNRFSDAVFRLAQLVHDSDAEVTPILFTWPSRGSVFAYGYDRESATLSRDAFEQLLNMLVSDPAVGKIDILAHSMGNFLAVETLRQIGLRHGAIPPKIADVMLAAPDVDVDLFEKDVADRVIRARTLRYSLRETTRRLRSPVGFGAATRGWEPSIPTPRPTRADSRPSALMCLILPISRPLTPPVTPSSSKVPNLSALSGIDWRADEH
jgi:esterase/lipase superfamily enzyme